MDGAELKKGIHKAIVDFLTDDDWKYSLDETNGIFSMGVNIDGKLKSIELKFIVKDTSFRTIGLIEVKADNDCKKDVCEFLTRANCGLTDGCFEMNYDTGTIIYRIYHDCTDGIPSTDTVKRSVFFCVHMIKRYGNGLLAVMFGMQTPKEAIESSEKSND